MIRGWLLLFSLVLSVVFKLWPDFGFRIHTFLYSDETLNTQSLWYYRMEHWTAIIGAGCLLIHDNTPRFIIWIFFTIICIDLMHFELFYRDKGIGFNLIKVIILGIPLLYLEIRNQWKLLKN